MSFSVLETVERKFLQAGQEHLEMAVKNARAQVREAVRVYESGRNELSFGGSMLALLEVGHTQAAVIGRRRAGDYAPTDADDRKFGATAARKDLPYLKSFLDDLAGGRYDAEDGSLKLDAVTARADLYPLRMAGTANETLLLASGDEALWWWVLGGSSRPCEECPSLAAGSPYTAADLGGRVPGDGSTPCLFNCACSLQRDDGLTGFTVPEMDGE